MSRPVHGRLPAALVCLVLAVATAAVVSITGPGVAHASIVPAGENPSGTAYVYSGLPDQNFCCAAQLNSSPSSYRTYLEFPVAIPASATITSATLNWDNITGGLTSGVEVHLGTGTSFSEGPGSGESTCHSDASACLTWNNQPYNSTAIGTTSTPSANSLVSFSVPVADLTPGTPVVFALRSLTAGVIDKIAGEFSGNGPTLQISYTGSSNVQNVSGAAYTDATTGNTNTNHGGANPLKSSPSSYYGWLQFNLGSCAPGSCGIPSGATVTGGQLTFFNTTSGEAAVDVHGATADNWTPGTGGNAGNTTCYLNPAPCIVYSNQPYSSAVLSTFTFPGSSLNTSATVGVPATSIHPGGFSSYALKGTTSGLVDNIDNGTHAASLTIQYSASVSQAIPSGLCGGDGAASHASKVMVIYEENRQYNQVIGSANAPYINNTIKAQCALAASFTSRASGGHSLANYVESTDAQRYEGLGPPGTSAGSSANSLCTNNCISQTNCAMGQTAPCWTVGTPDVVPGSTENATTGYLPVPPGSYDNLYNQQGSSGWKAYGESMPSNCFIAGAGGDSTGDAYHPRHIPALYYTSLNGGSTFSGTNCNAGTQMASDAVPLALTTDNTGRYTSGNLVSDVNSGTLPKFSTVTPNLCDDMHDTCTQQANCGAGLTTNSTCVGDQWLAGLLPTITAGPDYQSGDLAIIIVWDEGTQVANGTTANWPFTCANYTNVCVPALVLSRETGVGVTSATAYDDWSITRTADDVLGKSYLGNAGSSNSFYNDSAFGLH